MRVEECRVSLGAEEDMSRRQSTLSFIKQPPQVIESDPKRVERRTRQTSQL